MREEGLLKKLVAAHGVSGFEKNVRKIIEEEAAPYADEMTVDAIGNLIVLKKGTDGENKKKLMFAAHMDEIGFMVKKIEAAWLAARAGSRMQKTMWVSSSSISEPPLRRMRQNM